MFNLDSLRALAAEAGHEINSEVHRFLDWIERKHAAPEQTVAEVQAAQAEPPAAEPAAAPEGEAAAPAEPPAP